MGLALLLVGVYVVVRYRITERDLAPIEKTLLYVRPFANLSPGEKEFVDGLTVEMITQLGRVDPKSIGVFAPTTSNELKDKTIRELRQILKADSHFAAPKHP